ncbi:MAG: response regulator [Acidobacteriota bacterium]
MATILVVDDQPVNREFLVTLLGYKGHRLIEAADGAEGLDVARRERPDLIISDILMPTMDGYEFVRQLRSDEQVASTPVIFFSAHYLEREARMLALSCGVEQIITKPCEPEAVLKAVDHALESQQPLPPPPHVEEFDREHVRIITDKLSQKAYELRRANLRLNALVELNQHLASMRNPLALVEKYCQESCEIIGVQQSVIAMLEHDGQTICHLFASGLDASSAALIFKEPSFQDAFSAVLKKRQPARQSNLNLRLHNPVVISEPTPINSLLIAPLATRSQVYGWLALANKLGVEGFTEGDERLAVTLASQLALAYENAKLYMDAEIRADALEREMIERKRAEEKYRSIFENAVEGIFQTTATGEFITANPALSRMLGYDSPEDMTTAINDVAQQLYVDPEDRSKLVRILEEKDVVKGYEVRLKRRNESVVWALVNMRAVRDSNGKLLYFEGSVEDISERKKLEEQLLQSQKMEAVGRLAGGVAHDFNNLLTAIIGYSQMVMTGLGGDHSLCENIREVLDAARRAAALTNQLLIFSRKQVSQPEILDLDEVISNLSRMLKRLIGEDIEVEINASPSPKLIKADLGQIEQIILNLSINARDAMPQGGMLVIETDIVHFDDRYFGEHLDLSPGHYVMLAVSDTGCGMGRGVLPHIFEPFFTTKGIGKGTGLGLSTVYGIVRQSGGGISVYSEPDYGTVFKIYFPRASEDAELSRKAEEPDYMPEGTETLLLVEDDPIVQQLAASILQTQGYTVFKASDGKEALQIVAECGSRIDLLLTDVVMPQMSGRELAEHIKNAHPGIRVLFVSGYTDDALLHYGLLNEGVTLLQKPFAPGLLARKVREVLDAT